MPIPTEQQADQRKFDVVGGVDTHKDMHMAAVITTADGVVLGTEAFSTTRAEVRAMLHWMRSGAGERCCVVEGPEQTGPELSSAGFSRHLALAGVPVLPEVTGPAASRTALQRKGRRARCRPRRPAPLSPGSASRWRRTAPVPSRLCAFSAPRGAQRSNVGAPRSSSFATPSWLRQTRCASPCAI